MDQTRRVAGGEACALPAIDGYATRMRSEIPHKFLLNFEKAIAEEEFLFFIYEDAVTVVEPKILRNFRIMRKRKRNNQQPYHKVC